MPTNPFDVDQLNGVTFNSDALGFIKDVDSSTYSSSVIVTYVSSAGSNSPPVNPGTVSVLTNEYTQGFYSDDDFVYILPTFGSITFSEVLDDNGQPKVFWIHGFSENGILINADEVSGQGLGNFYSASYMLSTYGFGVDGPRFPVTFDKDPTVYAIPPVCFVAGTRLLTPSGPVAVEDLQEGDVVVTASGTNRPVTWIGQMLVRPKMRPRPNDANPVLVRPHAFGPDLPSRDVRLSPGHSVLVDGVLVPVGLLVNGVTILQEEVDEVRYFHIELESHDVVLAEGLPCESYLDDGNRSSFANADNFVAIQGRLDPQNWENACAPMVAAGPQLVALQQRLNARAEELGWTKSEDPALRLEVDGTTVAPIHVAGNRFWFVVPATEALTLRSNAGVLAHLMPGLADGRQLGVAVGELRINGFPLDLDDAMFGDGFYPTERHENAGWRWTDGAASVTTGSSEPMIVEVAVTMVAPSWSRAAPDLRVVA